MEEVESKHTLVLDSITARGGGFNLTGCRIRGDLDMRHAIVASDRGGISLVRATIQGRIDLQSSSVSTNRDGPAVSLEHGSIDAQAILSNVTVRNMGGPGLSVQYASFGGALDLTKANITVDSQRGALQANSVHVKGALTLDRISIDNASGTAFRAINGRVDLGLSVDGDSSFRGRGPAGTIRIIGARIGGQAVFYKATIVNERGPAFVGSGLHVKGGFFLRWTHFEASSQEQAVDLKGLHCEANLDIQRVAIISHLGCGLAMDQAQIGGSLTARRFGISARGNSGALRMVGARITGQLSLTTCRFSNQDGPCVVGDGIEVSDDLAIAARSQFLADYPGGALRLLGAKIGGQFAFTESFLTNPGGPGINCQGAEFVTGVVLKNSILEALTETVRLISASSGGDFYVSQSTIKNPKGSNGKALVLQSSTIAGALRVKFADLVKRSRPTRLVLDLEGTTYGSLATEDTTLQTWQILLRSHTDRFSAQPYQQLAKALRESGHPADAKKILIQQERDRREVGANMDRSEALWHRLKGSVIGYGYQPHKAIAPFVTIILVTIFLVVGAGLIDPLVLMQPVGQARDSCSVVEQLSFSGDVAIPLIGAGFRFQQCSLTDGPLAQSLLVFTTILRFASWALATLFVAGFTGLIKRD